MEGLPKNEASREGIRANRHSQCLEVALDFQLCEPITMSLLCFFIFCFILFVYVCGSLFCFVFVLFCFSLSESGVNGSQCKGSLG